ESLLLVWVASELWPQVAPRPAARSLTLESSTGEIRSVALSDGVEYKPVFSGIDSANAFVLAAKRLGQMHRHGSDLLLAASNVACSGLAQTPPHDERPFANVHVEHLLRIEGVGIYASGWMLPASSHLERCRAWCPETGEFAEFDTTLSRTVRPDVIDALKSKRGFGGPERL